MDWVVLLRGINVNGTRMAMADVRSALQQAGFEAPRTVLATGNVLLTSDDARGDVKQRCEDALRTRFDYDAWVLIFTADEVREIAEAFPFDAGDDARQPYVVFSNDAELGGELAAAEADDDEQLARGPHGCLFWDVAKGSSTDTAFAKALSRQRYRSSTTTRNLRTVHKLLA